MYDPLTPEEQQIGTAIVEAATYIHRELGPGLLEKVYETCFIHVLRRNGYKIETQVHLPIHFEGEKLNESLRLDVIVNDLVICELKAAEGVHPIWKAQVLSYLKLTNKRLGYVLNFCTPLMKHGISRVIL